MCNGTLCSDRCLASCSWSVCSQTNILLNVTVLASASRSRHPQRRRNRQVCLCARHETVQGTVVYSCTYSYTQHQMQASGQPMCRPLYFSGNSPRDQLPGALVGPSFRVRKWWTTGKSVASVENVTPEPSARSVVTILTELSLLSKDLRLTKTMPCSQ
jgi:hypothetical protein